MSLRVIEMQRDAGGTIDKPVTIPPENAHAALRRGRDLWGNTEASPPIASDPAIPQGMTRSPRSEGHDCDERCTARTCECPPCACSDCEEQARRASGAV